MKSTKQPPAPPEETQTETTTRRSRVKRARGGIPVKTDLHAGDAPVTAMHDMQMTPVRNLRG